MNSRKIDLHVHSTASDGTLTPAELVAEAKDVYKRQVEDIADYVGLSRSHLFRSFQNVLHISPKEYLTVFRMKQACYLLEHSNLSITAIANSIGFDNSLYFSKIFHKQKQMSPRDYRKQFQMCIRDSSKTDLAADHNHYHNLLQSFLRLSYRYHL